MYEREDGDEKLYKYIAIYYAKNHRRRLISCYYLNYYLDLLVCSSNLSIIAGI